MRHVRHAWREATLWEPRVGVAELQELGGLSEECRELVVGIAQPKPGLLRVRVKPGRRGTLQLLGPIVRMAAGNGLGAEEALAFAAAPLGVFPLDRLEQGRQPLAELFFG